MRLLILTCIFLFPAFLFAQSFEPLYNNPELQAAHAKKHRAFRSLIAKAKQGIPESLQIIDEQICLLASDTFDFCIDTIGRGGSGSAFDCLNCNAMNFGTVSVDSTCFSYAAMAVSSFGVDTLSIVFCPVGQSCDTFRYIFTVHRPGMTQTDPVRILDPEELVEVFIDFSMLPPPVEEVMDLNCNDPILGEAIVVPNRFFYRSKRFSGSDTVCILLQSQRCVADTAVYPFQINQDTLPASILPFQDDFSANDFYPNPTRWLDDRAYINKGLGTNVPTLGVASLDGLDDGGNPYGGDYDVSDLLTSAYINLDRSQVSGTVFLSFFYQFKGNGYSLGPNDSLIVEFKQADGKWNKIDGFTQDTFFPFQYQPPFQFAAYVLDEQYMYNGFQFRFKNYSDNRGGLEPWNIDVVRLGRDVPSEDYNDLAFVEPPAPILKAYSAMPIEQFKANIPAVVRDAFPVHIRNNFDATLAITSDLLRVRELPFDATADLLQPGSPLTGNIDALSNRVETYTVPPADQTAFVTALQGLSDDEQCLSTRYDATSGLATDAIPENNTVERITCLTNYYAYDDGTAERRLTPTATGHRIAIEYEAFTDDSLKAVQYHFPFYPGSFEGRTFRLQVWVGELDDEPEYEEIFAEPFYVSGVTDSLQAFTTYVLMDAAGEERMPLFIPTGKFWVGYETNSTPIPVGFDVSTPAASPSLYYNAGSNWVQVDEVSDQFKGAVMIRPVLGKGKPIGSSVDELVRVEWDWTVYPNPVINQEVHLSLNEDKVQPEQFSLQLFTANGRHLRSYKQMPVSISVASLPAGTYILQLQHLQTGQMTAKKLIVQP